MAKGILPSWDDNNANREENTKDIKQKVMGRLYWTKYLVLP